MIFEVILYCVIIILILLILINLFILIKLLVQGIKGKGDKVYRLKKILHSIFLAFMRTGKRYTDFGQYGQGKITKETVALGAAFDLGVQALEKHDPAVGMRKKIKAQIEEAIVILDKAKANALKHQSKEAQALVLDCYEALQVLFNSLDQLESITETIERISKIKEQAQIIAEAPTFNDEDNAPNNSGTQASKNYYDILRLAKNATTEEIKKAYKDLAKKYHPDLYSHLADDLRAEAEKRFKEINEAYQTLADPQKRRDYDLTL